MRRFRQTAGGVKSLTTSATTTPEIDIEGFALGEVYVPAASPINTLTFHLAMQEGGTYLPAYDSAGAAVTLTVAAGRAYPLPATIFGGMWMRIVANAAGDVSISVKS